MDEKPRAEVDADIDDALASMMRVAPSPEFRARVRRRIAGDADAREWTLVQRRLPAVAAAVIVVLGILFVLTGTRPIAPERVMTTAATRVLEPGSSVSPPLTEPAAVVAIQQEQPPTVFVPRSEIVTMQRLLSAAQADRFPFELVPAGVPVAAELSTPEPISMPPIELMPIGASSSFE